MTHSDNKHITILQLYPRDMNIYGDNGNVITLKKRLEWQGYDPLVITYNVGDTLPKSVDIVIGGGGQDSGQDKIHADLLSIRSQLNEWAQQGVPMLLVCGLYQLFGHFFETASGTRLEGIGIFNAETYATSERLIGNIVTHSKEFGDIIGYENHSGQTYLLEGQQPFASVIRGAGNSLRDNHEGARSFNVIGTYLHGSLLPKNPAVADFLLATAIERKFGTPPKSSVEITPDFTEQARRIALRRPR